MKRLAIILLLLLLAPCGAEAASRFAVCTTTCTWDNSDTSMWSATSGGATGASTPTTSDNVTLNASTCVGGTTCTITVNANIAVSTLTMGACTASTAGCVLDFSAHNNNITISGSGNAFSNSGTGTRNLKMGNGTWTLTNNGTVTFTQFTTTNLTFTANSSTVSFTGTAAGAFSRVFIGGGLTYNILSLGAVVDGITQIQGTNTITTLNITAPGTVTFEGGFTQTITNAINLNGTSTNQIGLFSSNSTQAIISSANNGNMTWVGIWDMRFQGGGTFTATNSMNVQPNSNTGVTITSPAAFTGAGGACIIGGWLLWRDLPQHINDNFPAWLEKAA